jgi:tetratricopeptide (TPR) repeat protein
MKKLIIAIALLLIIPELAYSQLSKKYEELLKAVNKYKFADAIKISNEILNIDSNYKDVLYQRGYINLMTSNFDIAISDYNKAIIRKQRLADAYNERGLALGYIGEIDSAVADFNSAISIEPKFPMPYVNRATAYLNINDKKSALEDFEKALNLDKNLPEVYYQKGKIYYGEKEYQKAILEYEKALRYGYNKGETYFSMGQTFFKQKNFKKAVDFYTLAIKADKNKFDAFNNRAIAYDSLGKKDLAKKDREFLNKASNFSFEPIESLKFERYFTPDSLISISVPNNWKISSNNNSEESFIMFSADKEYKEGLPRFGLIQMRVDKEFSKRTGITAFDSTLSYWKSASNKNYEKFEVYNIYQEKHRFFNGKAGVTFDTHFQMNKNLPIYRQYELIIPYEGKLYYGFLQCPDKQFGYYSEIFIKAMDSIIIR